MSLKGKCNSIREFVQGNAISTRSHDPKNVMGRHIEGYWVRKDNWFLRWHVTDNELELFDLNKDLRNDNDVSKDYPRCNSRVKETGGGL